eukprot:403333123
MASYNIQSSQDDQLQQIRLQSQQSRPSEMTNSRKHQLQKSKTLFQLMDSMESSESSGKYENMYDLLLNMSQPYKQETFSLKFIDKELEKDYQRQQHQQNLSFMWIYLAELVVVLAIYISFQIYKYIIMDGNYPNIRWAGLSIVILLLIATIQCFLSRKYLWISLQITPVQTICMLVVMIECGVLGNPTFGQVDLFSVITGLIASLSFLSYCQKTLFWTYVICMVFLITRTWLWIDEKMRFYRFNIYFLTSFTFIYIFSRQMVIKEREKFKRKQNQKQMLQMFQNLMTTHHDGIIITENEDILFFNDQIDNIFDLEKLEVSKSDEENMEAKKKEQKQKIKESLRETKYKIDRKKTLQVVDTDENSMTSFNSIWDYIITHTKKKLNRNILSQRNSFLSSQLQDIDERADGAYFTFENYQDLEDVKKKKLQVYTSTINSGPKTYVMTTIRDMSFWLEYQKEKNMSGMKTIAFASAAHEFRNPLNAIISSLDLLDNYITQERARQFLITAKVSSNLMLYLVNDILDFSQIEANNFILNIQQTHIKDCMEEIVSILEFKANSKNIELSYQIKEEPRVPEEFACDANRMKQILINLVSNGIKYTLEGYVKIIVKYDYPTNMILFKVKDTGVGICEEQHAKLFSAFTKIMKNRDLNKEGCGLGLQVSKNLANAMGGNIEFKSMVGRGSTFTLSLPYHKDMEEFNAASNLEFRRAKSNFTTFRNKLVKREQNQHDSFNLSPSYQDSSLQYEVLDDLDNTSKNNLIPQLFSMYVQDDPQIKSVCVEEKLFNSKINQFRSIHDVQKNCQKDPLDQQNKLKLEQVLKVVIDDDLEKSESHEIAQIGVYNSTDFYGNNFTERELINQDQDDSKFRIKLDEISIDKRKLRYRSQIVSATTNISSQMQHQRPEPHKNQYQLNRPAIENQQQQHVNSKFKEQKQEPQQLCKCPQVLIVDDEPFNLIALEGILEISGVTKVEKAFNGKDGLNKYLNLKESQLCKCTAQDHEENAVKMVFSDFNMPIMNGLQMTKQIIQSESYQRQKLQNNQAVLVLISGNVFSGEQCIEVNQVFDHIITKPISCNQVKELVNLYINNY